MNRNERISRADAHRDRLALSRMAKDMGGMDADVFWSDAVRRLHADPSVLDSMEAAFAIVEQER